MPNTYKASENQETKVVLSHGGRDEGDKGLRYLEWTIDQDPNDGSYCSYMAYMLKEGNRIRQSTLDENICGLFPEADWLKIIEEVGFRPRKLPYHHSEFQKGARSMFIGLKDQ